MIVCLSRPNASGRARAEFAEDWPANRGDPSAMVAIVCPPGWRLVPFRHRGVSSCISPSGIVLDAAEVLSRARGEVDGFGVLVEAFRGDPGRN